MYFNNLVVAISLSSYFVQENFSIWIYCVGCMIDSFLHATLTSTTVLFNNLFWEINTDLLLIFLL